MQKLWTVRDLSRNLQLHVHYVYRMIYERKITYLKIGGAIRFRAEEVERWLRDLEVNAKDWPEEIQALFNKKGVRN